MNFIETKVCAKCKVKKTIDNFAIRKIQGKYRLFSYCKDCERKMNNNRYKHTCIRCGKEYRSGKKDSKLCKKCCSSDLGQSGRERLKKFNSNQYGENNHMFGIHRYGKDNPNYNPNKTDEEREKGRCIIGYKEWRNSVYSRDNYTCQCCGDNKGSNLNAHHLNGYNWDKQHRTDINNGVTLCEECHKKFHSIYGWGNNTKEQFNDFLNNNSIK